MKKDELNDKILSIVEDYGETTISSLFEEIKKGDPDLPYSTLKWRIYSLKEEGVLRRVGRGQYVLGEKGDEYRPIISHKLRLINKKIKENFPYARMAIWSTQWLSDFMLHQPMSHFIVVEVEPDALSAVFDMLKDLWNTTRVLYKPGSEEFDRYSAGSQDLIVVLDLISESPLMEVDSATVPMMEKIVVDLFASKNIFEGYRGKELSNIFNEFSSKYFFSKTKMFRYARRRNCQKDLSELLGVEL